ncbi:MAG TPA: hypothetical protein PKG71_00975 [Candidatus Woesebacteria bacterium]|nr:hypothetical protein [Candidatus Woesebacteria bacterium]HNS94519.1 hypothetical protein [Candidatus Woesebacteria bacterium]
MVRSKIFLVTGIFIIIAALLVVANINDEALPSEVQKKTSDTRPSVDILVSDPRIVLAHSDERKLLSELNDLYGFDQWLIYQNTNGELTSQSIQFLTIDFTQDFQPWIGMYIGNKDTVFSRFDFRFTSPTSGTLFINLEPSVYSDDLSLSNAANISLRSAIYAIKHWNSFSSHDDDWLSYGSQAINKEAIISIFRTR